MTCIIGLVRDGKVYMGGDGQYLDGWHRIRSTNPKIFRLGDMLIGSDQSQRISDIIQYNFDPGPDKCEDPADFFVQDFIPTLQNDLEEFGAKQRSQEGTDKMEAAIMIGYKGRLFVIGEDFALSQIASDYEAIGAGARYARGYLYAMRETSNSPEKLIGGALECAAHFSAAVSEPFTILEI